MVQATVLAWTNTHQHARLGVNMREQSIWMKRWMNKRALGPEEKRTVLRSGPNSVTKK